MRAIWYSSKLPSATRPSLTVISCHIVSLNPQAICPSICLRTESGFTNEKPSSNTTSTRSSRSCPRRLTDTVTTSTHKAPVARHQVPVRAGGGIGGFLPIPRGPPRDGQGPSIGIQGGLEPANAHGTIFFPEAHVLFGGPNELYRPSAQGLGHGDGLAQLVGTAATAVSATEEGGVNEDFVRTDT